MIVFVYYYQYRLFGISQLIINQFKLKKKQKRKYVLDVLTSKLPPDYQDSSISYFLQRKTTTTTKIWKKKQISNNHNKKKNHFKSTIMGNTKRNSQQFNNSTEILIVKNIDNIDNNSIQFASACVCVLIPQ